MHFYENDIISLYLSELKKIEELDSSKQKLTMYTHPQLGYIFTINDEIQHIEKYQTLYHDMLVHLPMSFICKPQDALIIGGGSLFAAYEILKYPTIKTLTLCDYDHVVLELMKKYYPHALEVMNSPKFEFIEKDGIDFIENLDRKYDIIINDCFNLSQASENNNINLFHLLSNALSEFGVCCDIIYRHIFDRKTTINTLKELRTYQNTAFSLVFVPEYPGVLHLETMWGNNKNLNQKQTQIFNEYQKEITSRGTKLFNYYNPQYLSYYLYLPPYITKQFTI